MAPVMSVEQVRALNNDYKARGQLEWWPDHRQCRCCLRYDDNFDLVHKHLPFFWGYPRTKNGKNQGMICFYDYKVFRSRYYIKNVTLTALLKVLGTDQEEKNKFDGYRDTLIEKYIEAGSHDIDIDWKLIDITVERIVLKEIVISSPQDRYVPICDYRQEYNVEPEEKGHKVLIWEGEECALIPGKREWLVTRNERHQIKKKERYSGGDMQSDDLGKLLDDNFTAMAESMFANLPTAVGERIPVLVAGAAVAVTPSRGPKAPLPLADAEGGDGADGSIEDLPMFTGFGAQPRRVEAVQTPDNVTGGKVNAKAKSKKGASSSGGGGSGNRGSRVPPQPLPSVVADDMDTTGDDPQIKKRGRPMRHSIEICKEMIDEFQSSGEGQRYFANEDNSRRSFDRYKKMLEKVTETDPTLTADQVHQLPTVKKQMTAAYDFMKRWYSASMSSDMSKAYNQHLQFLQMEPRAENIFPKWLRIGALRFNIEVSRLESLSCLS